MRNLKRILLTTSTMVAASVLPTTAAQAQSNPSVVVTIENAQPARGTFLTPVWMGIHDGTFDSYDGGQIASVPLGGNEIEALAEDGNNGPITATFDALQPGAPQTQGLAGPSGPLAPGDRASFTFNVDPENDRYFSYASMIIPSNDFFIANGNPLAHQLFNDYGQFVGKEFVVSGDETNDAGTEINDELASNVAFLAQAAPDTGVPDFSPVVTPAPGFAPAGNLSFPNGVLNHPVFALGDFNDADDALLRVSFRYVDLGGRVRFRANLSPDQEVNADPVHSKATGFANAISNNGRQVRVNVRTRRLTGQIVAAHLHLGQPGTNGPVIANLTNRVRGERVRARISANNLTGPLSGQSLQDLVNQMAAGNVYVNIHTSTFPDGELRGQINLR